jgi:hypothetical protein
MRIFLAAAALALAAQAQGSSVDRFRVRLVAEGPDGSVFLGSDDGKLTRLQPAAR